MKLPRQLPATDRTVDSKAAVQPDSRVGPATLMKDILRGLLGDLPRM